MFVRRISLGATLSVLLMPTMPKGSSSNVTTSPPFDALYATTPLTGPYQRMGYGATAQLMLTGRLGVNASLFMRRIGYKFNSDIFTGTDNPLTTADERTHTVMNNDTRAKLYDLPVVVRFYGKDRHEAGTRWFAEFGGSIRRVSNIRTAIDTTINDGTLTCCDNTPTKPAKRNVHGLVGGAGLQFIDPLGIRVVPEVRYTRWMGETFNSIATITRRNQVEAMISLTF